jgi:hypothetical protein
MTDSLIVATPTKERRTFVALIEEGGERRPNTDDQTVRDQGISH